MNIRTYSELKLLDTFEERFKYLELNGEVGKETFGYDRFMNQKFYRSKEWKSIRDFVIVRDKGCDLGIDGREIQEKILIHHMNPILPKDFLTDSDFLMNPEYLISTVLDTHNAIHFGSDYLSITTLADRSKNDTCPWKQKKEELK